MEKVIDWLCSRFGIVQHPSLLVYATKMEGELANYRDALGRLEERIELLEAAYPDYKKAKAEADENKAHEVIPGFRPFSQRKRAWEASRRKAPEKK